jgi:hypothetical protein
MKPWFVLACSVDFGARVDEFIRDGSGRNVQSTEVMWHNEREREGKRGTWREGKMKRRYLPVPLRSQFWRESDFFFLAACQSKQQPG